MSQHENILKGMSYEIINIQTTLLTANEEVERLTKINDELVNIYKKTGTTSKWARRTQ